MVKKQKDLASTAPAKQSRGRLNGFLADEGSLNRRTLWRLAGWGAGSVGAVVIALLAQRSGNGLRHDQIAAADLARQSQQFRTIAKAGENEIRRLSSAIDILNSDRDRLFARVTVLEQGIDSVTGSISRNTTGTPSIATPPATEPDLPTATGPSAATLPPVMSHVASQPATLALAPPAPKPGEADETAAVAPATPEPNSDGGPRREDAQSRDAQIAVVPVPATAGPGEAPSPPAPVAVAHTDFGVDLGRANSIKGLRMLWRSVLKSNEKELASLHPVIVVNEGQNGIGMQLRLVAGPLADAAEAARICAVLSGKGRACETSVFEGQRLATNEHGKASGAIVPTKKPRGPHASSQHRHSRRAVRTEQPAPAPPSTGTGTGRL